MIKKYLLLFTITFYAALVWNRANADVITQENLKTHLRWNVLVPRDQFFISKKGQTVELQTINLDLFEKLANELPKLNKNEQYVKAILFSKENFPAKPATINLSLNDSSVEVFSFYRDADKKYIVDFWINSDAQPPKEKKEVVKKILSLPAKKAKSNNSPSNAVTAKLETNSEILERKSDILKVSLITPEQAAPAVTNQEFRDFRYGANFVWDYLPMMPQLERDINLASKIPEFLYPIQDRANLDDPKEAHMQLTINFYRATKWGLMNKSINLYQKKYGRDSNYIFNEFIKVNAILKDHIAQPNRGITQSAMVLLTNIKDLTNDYELKSSILRYLIQYNVDQRDHVKTLELAKQLFVNARAEFDQTMVIQSALTILHALTEIKQVDKIDEFLSDKKLMSILPPQMGFAYKTFALISKGETKELIAQFKKLEKSLAKPIHPAILYNVAESYFRHADYETALRIYDDFVATYSYLMQAPHARLRMALIYELMEKPTAETLTLYKNAIDRSTVGEIRYEAKLRYVGMKIARKIKPSKQDIETAVFLEQSPDETKAMNINLKKLLWLTRLRIFISTKEYDKALSYLSSLPLESFSPAVKRVFDGDGAEIIFGLIQASYLNEDYAKAVKMWEIYKNKYETKVATNAYLNFVVCDSYIKLGLFKSYDRAFEGLKNAQAVEPRNFPIWVERSKSLEVKDLAHELEVIRLVAEKNWDGVSDKLATFPVSLRDSKNYNFYQALVYFNQKKYQEAVPEFEKVLVRQEANNQFTPRQTADLLMGYVESLYQLKNQEKFKTVVKALTADIDKSKSASILNISERINYLLIETYAGESTEWQEVEKMTKSFREKFQKSPYNSRVAYLYGLSLIKNSKVNEGKEVLRLLTNSKEVPSHIKEMCRSELTTLELIEKQL
jgi:tetratricopeptide (TPR) repeat protein